ncbi:MAG: VOC family protein [Acidimicrobiia bacterium]|nr:VOC family protein [Acidimicrobiia bacterium]
MTAAGLPGVDLDHVAIAVERWADAWPRLVGTLGARWMSGGRGPGFAPCQLGFANGMRVEVLEPHLVDRNDFLRRFLDRSGPGPHHMTFKVNDLPGALEAAQAAGYRPINVDMSDRLWQEAFLHPKESCGVVIQLAHSIEGYWETPPPDGFPVAAPVMASLDRIVHAVADLDAGFRLFAALLGGSDVERGSDESARWVELAWPGPGRVRLMAPTSPASPVATWIGDRPGRVHHLAFSGVSGAGVEGAVALADGGYELPPDDATGTRLLLLDR